MAIYYSRMSVISRGQGHSAVAAAAYRSAARFVDERTGTVHNFEKKKGVLVREMLAPDEAGWALDIVTVWNRAERAEGRCNARVARELIVALPSELESEAQTTLARRIGQDLVEAYGVAVLVAVHEPDRGSDARNVHAHLMMSTRVVGAEGFGLKVRCLDDKKSGPKEAETIRRRVAERINAALAEHGHVARVDSRRLSVQAEEAAERGDLEAVAALTRSPTRHVGRAGIAAIRRGEPSSIVNANSNVRRDNEQICAHGRQRAAGMRNDIRTEVARRVAARRTAGPAPRAYRAPGTASTPHPARPSTATAAYLESLRATERFIREQQRSGQRADMLRELAERLDRQADAALARAAATSRRVFDQVQADSEPGFEKPFDGSARAPRKHPSTPPQASAPMPQGSTPQTRREWAELRRKQRAAAVDGPADRADGQPATTTASALEAWRHARRRTNETKAKEALANSNPRPLKP